MGLFHKFMKREKEAKQDEKQASCANDNRRFTYVVEDTFQLLNQKGTVIVGTIHGTIKVKDAVYIMNPNNQIIVAEVSGLEGEIDGKMARITEATNTPVSILVADIKDKALISKYAIVTSIRPQPSIDVNEAIENAQILGLSYEYPRFYEDMEFMSILTYQIAHGHFLAPISMSKVPQAKEDGSVILSENTQISFPTLKDPSDEQKTVLPVFTDWNELSKWKNLFDDQHPAKTLILKFPDCAYMAKSNHSGFVINAFSECPVFVSNTMISSIEQMEGYQKEFGEGNQEQVQKVNIEKDTKVMIGVPAQSNEVDAVRKALTAFGERMKDIHEIYFLLKIDGQQEKTYLCIVDCPKEQAHEIFHDMYIEIKPYLIEISIVDFGTKEELSSLSEGLDKQAIVYPRLS